MERRMKLGLTDAEWENPVDAMFTGGLVKMWNCRTAITAKFKRRSRYDEAAEEEQFEKDKNQLGTKEAFKRIEQRAVERARHDDMAERHTPVWRNVSGFLQDEHLYGPMDRARNIMHLINAAARLIRYELKFHKDRTEMKPQIHADERRIQNAELRIKNEQHESNDGSGETRTAEQIEYEAGIEEEERQMCAVRSFLWDPLRAICAQLEIPQRKLSSFAKEVLGMSAPEIVDKIKAEGVRKRMKIELREFLLAYAKQKTQGGCQSSVVSGQVTERSGASALSADSGTNSTAQGEAEEIFAALKASRRAPRFHRTTWAIGYGFTSYPKFFRACLLCYGKTPHQLELEIIEELLKEMEPRMGTDERGIQNSELRIENERNRGGEQEEVVRRE